LQRISELAKLPVKIEISSQAESDIVRQFRYTLLSATRLRSRFVFAMQ
jgi:hypothetical protein